MPQGLKPGSQLAALRGPEGPLFHDDTGGDGAGDGDDAEGDGAAGAATTQQEVTQRCGRSRTRIVRELGTLENAIEPLGWVVAEQIQPQPWDAPARGQPRRLSLREQWFREQ